jgi:hypothetical protein
MKSYLKLAAFTFIASVFFSCQTEKKEMNNRLAIDNTRNLRDKVFLFENHQELSYKLNNTKLQHKNIVESIDLTKEEESQLVFFYTSDVCDVCETDIFDELVKIKEQPFYDNIIVFVPMKSLRDFKRFNTEYNLGLKKIYAYKDNLFHAETIINRGSFITLSNDSKVNDLFIPNKPIDSKRFNNYIDVLKEKYFNETF